MVKCPFCQFDNEEGALFCEQCKSDLASVAPAAPPPPPVAESPPIAAVMPLDEMIPLAPMVEPEGIPVVPLEETVPMAVEMAAVVEAEPFSLAEPAPPVPVVEA
ncbi:MAG: hypothetical protein IT429_20830, partial [Gemmataceae bacterium]|nr:hypothetical protein [Gemmataceae bacterium]